MATQNKEIQKPVYVETRRQRSGLSTFLSSIAVLLSTLALICSGFVAYQVFLMRQLLDTTAADPRNNPVAITNPVTPSPVPSPTAETSVVPAPPQTIPVVPTPAETAVQTPATVRSIQPGQFVQPAFGRKAQVELLSIKRIKDPELGTSDVVNVQMRIRRLAVDGVSGRDVIALGQTTVRNSETSETYEAVDSFHRATDPVSLLLMRPQTSADGYVWMRVPEGVNSLDIFVPETAGFKSVPISN